MRFFLKSIDVWQIVESGWTKPHATTAELTIAQTSARLSNNKAPMLYVKFFHRLNSLEFQTVNPLKKCGKSWKQHIRAQKLLNLPSSKC
jgi:NADPH-dependent 7-cyano-7-deazaguanine reductase QueF-like protein